MGDDLLAFVVETDVQSVCLPLGCAQDQAKEALIAGDCAPCCGCNVLDVQLPVDEIDLWVNVKGLLDTEWCIFIEGIAVLGWVVALLLTLLRCSLRDICAF